MADLRHMGTFFWIVAAFDAGLLCIGFAGAIGYPLYDLPGDWVGVYGHGAVTIRDLATGH